MVCYVHILTRKATIIKHAIKKEYTANAYQRMLQDCISNYAYTLLPCNVITTKTKHIQERLRYNTNIKTYRRIYGDTQYQQLIQYGRVQRN